MGKLKYSWKTKLAALLALERNGGNVYRTAKELCIPVGTLGTWLKAQREGRLPAPVSQPELPELSDDATLDEWLEQVARQMVAAMPQKMDEASLQEIARSLMMVLESMNQTRADKEKTSHAREKLAEILERYAANAGTEGADQPADG